MPELPEVETIVRGLAGRLPGRTIVATECSCPRIVQSSLDRVAGARITAVKRHGKLIILELEGLEQGLTIHLGMTGKLLLDKDPGPYARCIFLLDQGWLVYDDVRTLGRIDPGGAKQKQLGPDALSVDIDGFLRLLEKRKGRIKALLLNQSVMSGLGNIYTDEALFRAGVSPLASTAKLSRERKKRLGNAIQEVLAESISLGGSSISDYVNAVGTKGSFQETFRVYGRTGAACSQCGTPIRRIVVAQRGTHFCPRCQRK